MKRIKSNYHALKVLWSAQPKLRKAIILNGNRELINSISECVLNVLNGNLKVSDCDKRKLKKHKSVLRKVADKRVPHSTKKRLINQSGGRFLHPLLSAVLPTVANLLFRQRANWICYDKCILFQLIIIIIYLKHLLHRLHHMWKHRNRVDNCLLKKRRQHPYDTWVRFRERIQETNIKRGHW